LLLFFGFVPCFVLVIPQLVLLVLWRVFCLVLGWLVSLVLARLCLPCLCVLFCLLCLFVFRLWSVVLVVLTRRFVVLALALGCSVPARLGLVPGLLLCGRLLLLLLLAVLVVFWFPFPVVRARLV